MGTNLGGGCTVKRRGWTGVVPATAPEWAGGGGILLRSLRKVPVLRSSRRKATVIALLFSCSVTSTRFSQAVVAGSKSLV